MARLPDDRRAMFADVYKFYEEHWDMPDTPDAWLKCSEQLGPLSVKHGGTPLINNLLMACVQAIDDENRVAREALNDVL